jgi:AcrR family transcriptional regulator
MAESFLSRVLDSACDSFMMSVYSVKETADMAKPRSEYKRNSILSAATQVFAERGLGAPTAAITSIAGIAEGSLFTYFKTKDELINALYRELKLELADSMMPGFPRKQSVRHRLEHIWNGYVQWGVTNPDQQRVLKQIQVWSGLTQESKQAGSAPFTEIQRMAEDAVTQRIYKDIPQAFIQAALVALAEMTMDFMVRDPERAETYRTAGFEMLWAGITRR